MDWKQACISLNKNIILGWLHDEILCVNSFEINSKVTNSLISFKDIDNSWNNKFILYSIDRDMYLESISPIDLHNNWKNIFIELSTEKEDGSKALQLIDYSTGEVVFEDRYIWDININIKAYKSEDWSVSDGWFIYWDKDTGIWLYSIGKRKYLIERTEGVPLAIYGNIILDNNVIILIIYSNPNKDGFEEELKSLNTGETIAFYEYAVWVEKLSECHKNNCSLELLTELKKLWEEFLVVTFPNWTQELVSTKTEKVVMKTKWTFNFWVKEDRNWNCIITIKSSWSFSWHKIKDYWKWLYDIENETK